MRPSDIPRLASNFTRDMSKVALGAIQGKPVLAPSLQRAQHLTICRANSCGYYASTQDRCTHPACGCFCAAKTIFALLHCPINLW